MFEIGLGTILVAALTFVAGKFYAQSESVLGEKKRVYTDYLALCPTAHDAYKQDGKWEVKPFEMKPEFYLYASNDVIILAGRHLGTVDSAFSQITVDTPPLHPAFQSSVQAHNRMLIAMRRDLLGLSFHGFKERLIGSPSAKKLIAEDK
jgi:hypothetical protein